MQKLSNPRLRFPRTARVCLSAEYRNIFDIGKRVHNSLLTLHWCSNDANLNEPAKFGFVVSRKVDKRSVGRNRIKRCLREITRQHYPQVTHGYFVIVARSTAANASYPQLLHAYLELLRRSGALP